MRKYLKKQLLEVLETIQVGHQSIAECGNVVQRFSLLQDCQGIAIAVGEAIEQVMKEGNDAIVSLEKYCEEIYTLSQKELVSENDIDKLNHIIKDVSKHIEAFPLTYHVVFFPYKADMWDSLESIWKACNEDISCECFVVPIPYFELNQKNSQIEYCYEGNRFPEEIPILHYESYSMEMMQPDIAYVHNPYDDKNYVTTIHPAYYSDKLKEHVKNLVYVPYYVTTGFISEDQKQLPIHKNMDYIVLQSEHVKQDCHEMPYYNKILPFGSPKLDKVINACRMGVTIPQEWKEMLENKKVLMLNTSINWLLADGERCLTKIKSVFLIIQQQNKVALIWRPHPLLKATIQSLRPHLTAMYDDLLEFFIEYKIGILDQISDITQTVAIADGYIGESGSSVINLFGVTGKPIFAFNSNIITAYPEIEKRKVRIIDIIKHEDSFFISTNLYNALFCMDSHNREIQFIGRVEGQPKWCGVYPYICKLGNDLFLSPDVATNPAVYHIDSKQIECLTLPDPKVNQSYRKILGYKNKIFFLPSSNDSIIEYNIDTKIFSYYKDCIREMGWTAATKDITTINFTAAGKYLWVIGAYTNQILKFDMDEGSYNLYKVGSDNNGYSGIIVNNNIVWIAEVHSGDILKWDMSNKELITNSMPDSFHSIQPENGNQYAHLSLIDMGEWIISIPYHSNGMIKLNKESGKATMLINSFFEEKIDVYEDISNVCHFGMKIDNNTVWVQRTSDGAVAVVHVEEENYDKFYPILSEQEYVKMMDGEDGFEKLDEKTGFIRRENKWFSIEGYIDDLANDRLGGVKEHQLEALSMIAANLDGTCGEKVHQFMMEEVRKK